MAEDSSTTKKRVLVIEDESALLFALKAELSHEGYSVDAALSGEEGINKAITGMPDIIVLDLMLPEMSGFDVMERLNADEHTKNIPVLVVSNLADTEHVERGKQMGAVDYLVKTEHSLEKITQLLKKAIEEHV